MKIWIAYIIIAQMKKLLAFSNGRISEWVISARATTRWSCSCSFRSCIGFSKEAIQEFCDSSNGVLRLERVIYVDESQISEMISFHAGVILKNMRDLREWLVKEITLNDDDPDTDGLLIYNFDGMVEGAFIESLRLKTVHFKEEQEWRVFLSRRAYKNGDWVYNKKTPLKGPELFDETLDFLNGRIDFRCTNDDLVPYCQLRFEEFSRNPVVELWIGPKNYTRKSDAELFLWKYGYQSVDIYYSNITYR